MDDPGLDSRQEKEIFLFLPTPRPPQGPTAFCLMGTWVRFRGEAAWAVSLTTLLHIVPGLRMSGAIPLPPLCLCGVDRQLCLYFSIQSRGCACISSAVLLQLTRICMNILVILSAVHSHTEAHGKRKVLHCRNINCVWDLRF